MLDRGYMLDRPPPPPPWRRYLDRIVLPRLIDAAGATEAAVEQVAVQIRQRPLSGVALALAIGCGLGLTAARRDRMVRSRLQRSAR